MSGSESGASNYEAMLTTHLITRKYNDGTRGSESPGQGGRVAPLVLSEARPDGPQVNVTSPVRRAEGTPESDEHTSGLRHLVYQRDEARWP